MFHAKSHTMKEGAISFLTRNIASNPKTWIYTPFTLKNEKGEGHFSSVFLSLLTPFPQGKINSLLNIIIRRKELQTFPEIFTIYSISTKRQKFKDLLFLTDVLKDHLLNQLLASLSVTFHLVASFIAVLLVLPNEPSRKRRWGRLFYMSTIYITFARGVPKMIKRKLRYKNPRKVTAIISRKPFSKN